MTQASLIVQPWSTFEVVVRGADGKLESGRRPFSEGLFSGEGDPVQTALQKMRLVQLHGWPNAAAELKDDRGKVLIAKADGKKPPIYILKCKPSCWRLYFAVFHSHRRFVYLHAVCKKRDAQNAADSARARSLLAGLLKQPGGHGLVEFRFPSN